MADASVPTIRLNNGVEMPTLGFGVFQISNPVQARKVVTEALAVGYRLIDTAAAYQNEAAVGKAIKDSSVKRENIFVTSKLWVADFNYKRAKAGIDASLQRLGLDYLDLYLLHQPYGDVIGAWRALEEAQKEGKIRAIGVSNFFADQVKNLELTTNIKPAVNQIEINPWHQQRAAVQFLQDEGIQAEAWAPFAEGKHNLFTNPTIAAIAAKYDKTNSQVILRWLLQRGIIAIPKSIHQDLMVENIAVFDFTLSPTDMQAISALDTNESQFFDHRDPITIDQIFGTSLRLVRDDEAQSLE